MIHRSCREEDTSSSSPRDPLFSSYSVIIRSWESACPWLLGSVTGLVVIGISGFHRGPTGAKKLVRPDVRRMGDATAPFRVLDMGGG